MNRHGAKNAKVVENTLSPLSVLGGLPARLLNGDEAGSPESFGRRRAGGAVFFSYFLLVFQSLGVDFIVLKHRFEVTRDMHPAR
ncbi:MAG: hypothetical protein HW407_137 [Bacteroidetes bacterium]|nr:hypothetical protein [Bacteroidota bacterium]